MKTTIFFWVFICIIIPAKAQHKYDWNKYKNLSFKEDSVQSYINVYTKAGIIYPITQSQADIEIRMSFPNFFNLSKRREIYAIKCFKDSIVGECIEYSILDSEMYKVDSTVRAQSCSPIMKRVGKHNAYIVSAYHGPLRNRNLDSAIKVLLENRLFTLDDFSKTLDSIYKINPKLLDDSSRSTSMYRNPNMHYLLEVKLFKKYRNFRPGNSYYYPG